MKKHLHYILSVLLSLFLWACTGEMDDVSINAPQVTLGSVTDITASSAVIHADVVQHGGKISYYLIKYGTSESALTETKKYDANSGNVNLLLPSLKVNTTYYYQLIVSSGYSEVESEVRSFTTLNPAVSLSEATEITATTARFHIQLHLEGSTPMSCFLRYGTDALSLPYSVAISEYQEEIDIPLTSLQINTTYYCELVVNLGASELKSEIKSFTTLNPIISLSEAMNVSSSSALIQFSLSTGLEGNPHCFLRYGIDASSLTEELAIQDSQEILLTGLEASTTYYIQLVARYGVVERTSETKSFFTTKRNSDDPIVFVDSQVERICVEYWDINGDGKLSYQEASLVTLLEDRFMENVEITTFDELKFFSSLEEIGGFSDCLSLERISIPAGVTTIGPDAFLRCSNLKSISIPEGVTTIEWEAFYKCSNLTSITLPESLTYISDWAFSECGSLTYINVPEGVTDIGENAFWNCSSLKSISIPKQMERIRQSVFGYCTSLNHIEIPNGLKVIEIDAFVGCSNLSSISIPETVKIIGAEAFAGCSRLTSITIPEGVKSIEDHTFGFCSSLMSITIPASVMSIGSIVFEYCTSLKSVIVQATVPPTINDDTFRETDCTIYVPSESLEAYQTAWSSYASRIKAIP